MSFKSVLIISTFLVTCTIEGASAYFSSFISASDTLILDGDTIFVEHEQMSISGDSVILNPPTIKSKKNHIWSASLYSGLNVSTYSFQPTAADLLLLDDFIGNTPTPKTNWVGGMDIAARFLSISGPVGTIELAGVAGFNLNRLKARYTTLQTPSDLQKDSVLAFNDNGGELLMQYFTITSPPNIGEVDSLFPRLKQAMLTYPAPEITAKLRITLNRGQRALRYFMEAGIVHRNIQLKPQENNIYLLNNAGTWSTVHPNDLVVKRMLVPHIAAGTEMKVPDLLNGEGTFFTLGAVVNVSLPMSVIGSTNQLTLQMGNFGLSIYGRYFF